MSEITDDLRVAARYLLEDGFSLDMDEAVRIGIELAALAGAMVQAKEAVIAKEMEPK